jgi:hypothetical protein
VLAYVFWHRPKSRADIEGYEAALVAFHRSLAHSRPAGFEASESFRVAELPWIAGEGAGYEDWYLLDGFSSLGVLNEAAVGHGHRTAHDRAARQTGLGTAGLYGLHDGDTAGWQESGLAVWVERESESAAPALADLLVDGASRKISCLWRRQMSLGPAPEFCLQASRIPEGMAPSRLPSGWSTTTVEREALQAAR